MKWLLITTIGKNPGDEWIRIGIQKMISEVDPDGEYVLLDKEDPSVYKTAIEFDKCIWCGMPVFWSLGEEQNCKIFWWQDLMLGWPSERKNDFMLLGAGSFFPWGRELETIIYKKRLVKSAEDVLARSYYVTARDKVVSEVTGKPIPTMICPAVFSIIGHKKSHELKLANIMPQGGHYAVFGPEEAKIWDEKQYKISKILQENDFAYIAHNEKEVRFAQKCGWEKTVAYNGDPDGLLEYYGRCGKYFGNRVHGAIVARGNDADVWSVGYDSRQEAVKLSGARVSRLSELDIGEIADWASRDIKAESFDMKSEFEKQVGIVKRFMLAVDESAAVSQRAERPVKHNLKSERLDVLIEPFGINVSAGDRPLSDKLNIGCGLDYREGFINIDGNPDLPRVDYILEIKPGVLLDHFERGSFSYILAKDFLEHNFHWEACSLLKDFHSLLTNKGRLEIILPNVESIINDSTKEVAEKVRWLYGGQDIQESGDVVACDLSRKKYPQYYCHKYGWIPQTIKSELLSAGFSNVEITGGGWNMTVTTQKNLQTIHLSSLETQPDNLSLKDRKKVLIVRPDSIGDFVLFSGVLEYLKDFYRNCEIVVLVQEHIAGLAESCPYIDEVITFNRKKLVADKLYCSRIIEQLKERKFDIAINPVYSRDQIGDFLTLGSDADIKIASKGDGSNISEQKKLEHNSLYTRLIMANDVPMLETERNIEFLSDLMLKDIDWQCIPKVWVKQQDEAAINKLLGDLQIDNPIVICPFSQYAIKDWPLWKWIELIPRYKEHPIVICGSQKDRQKADSLINALEHNNVHNLCGRITLRQLAALLKRSRLCIGVDTGSIHIAVAVECSQVVIVGGGHFGRFMPYSPLTSIVCLPLDCFGCDWKCRYERPHCVRDVAPEVIAEAIQQSFERTSDKPRVFVQGDSLWEPKPGQPAWKAFDSLLDISTVEIIPVGQISARTYENWQQLKKGRTIETHDDKYLVSAIVSTYNSEKFIRGCLEDLENQTIADRLEIIVVNSGSQQNEEAIVKEFQQKYDNIKYLKTDERETIYQAWNRGIKLASGKYITNANTDDRHSPEMLERLAAELDRNENIAAVYSHFYVTTVENQTWETKTPERISDWHPPYSRQALLKGNFMGPQPMWRKSLHDEYGYFDGTLKVSGDYEFFLRVSQTHDFLLIPEPLGLYLFSYDSLERTAGTRDEEDERIWNLYRNNKHKIIRRPFRPDDPTFSIQTAHYNNEKSNGPALDYFVKAGEELNRENFEAAVEYMQKYRSMIDYSKLPRILNKTGRSSNIDVSVIIVTYNRTEDLKNCLASLSKQDDANFEVIVVDNGGSDFEVFQQYVDQYIKCPINFNRSEGRNIGACCAKGRIVAFLDDDALVGSDYISSIKSAFDKFDIIGLRGRTYPKSGPAADNYVSIYDLGDSPFPSYCNQEGNSAWLLKVYKSMDGMDPLLFGHEGSDLTFRIIKEYKQPNKIIYWPHTIIYHDYGTADKLRLKKRIHQRSANYLKYKHKTDIFVNRKDIEKYPLPLKQTQVLLDKASSTTEGAIFQPTRCARHPVKPLELPEVKYPNTVSAASTNHLNPKVSIVISCYNCEKFLPECLDSIRNQTMNEWELFLFDDASTDGTTSIIEKYSRMDERIKAHYFQDNKGPYVRRNSAIEQANSDFIVIQDADDIMYPPKLEILYNEIAKDERLKVVGSSYRMCLEQYKGLEYADKIELPITHDEIMQQYSSERYVCWHGSAIIRKSMFEQIGLYDEHPYGSDKFWLAKAAEYSRCSNEVRFKNVPEYLTLKREHSSSQQGLLPTLDPRSRRARFQTYWEYKLLKIREKLHNNPDVDIKAELRNCKCNDYIKRYGCLFEQWESQPLDDNILCRFISRGARRFNEGKYVRSIIILDSVEKILNNVTKRFKNCDLLRAMAYFAINMKQECLRYLNREIENHNNTAARKFISDYFENQLKTSVQDWCQQNSKFYNLQMADIERKSGAQQENSAVSERHDPEQSEHEKVSRSPYRAQAGAEPLVSVIMPAYNAVDYIKEAIESVLIQNYRNFELVIINDGSTDNTEEVVLGFKDERIRYFRQENRGLAATHNVGIKKSRGEFIIKLDSDDMMMPDFIARHLQEFENYSDTDLVYCDDYLINEDSKPIRVIERPEYTDRRLLIRDLFHCGFPVVPFRTCIRKSVFDKIGFFDEELLVAEDYDMMRRLVKHGLKIHHLKGALYLRRMTSDSLSRNYSARKAKSHFDVINRFIDTFTYDELFPNVAWDEIVPQMRQLHAKCLTAGTYLAIGQDYVKTNVPEYSKAAFDRACSELNDCVKIDPENQGLRQLLQKSKIIRARYIEAPQQVVSK